MIGVRDSLERSGEYKTEMDWRDRISYNAGAVPWQDQEHLLLPSHLSLTVLGSTKVGISSGTPTPQTHVVSIEGYDDENSMEDDIFNIRPQR